MIMLPIIWITFYIRFGVIVEIRLEQRMRAIRRNAFFIIFKIIFHSSWVAFDDVMAATNG